MEVVGGASGVAIGVGWGVGRAAVLDAEGCGPTEPQAARRTVISAPIAGDRLRFRPIPPLTVCLLIEPSTMCYAARARSVTASRRGLHREPMAVTPPAERVSGDQ
jgi:hypothetical protein